MPSLLVALAALAAATPAPAAYEGVWQGTVGDVAVRACFTNRQWGPFGAYYYLSQLKLIPLATPEKGTQTYREGEGADTNLPGWIVDQVVGDELRGRWAAPDRTLPIRLKRMAMARAVEEEEEAPCASRLFHGPRLAGLGTTTRSARKDGVAYTILSLDHRGRFEAGVRTFQLHGRSPSLDRINAELRRPLSADPPDWLECALAALSTRPVEGGFDESQEPTMISSRWLALVRGYDVYCGGAHPDTGWNYRTFDLAVGREVDLHDWLRGKAVKRERFEGDSTEFKTLRPAFVADVVLKGWKAEQAECRSVMTKQAYWSIGLTRSGFVFAPLLAHAVQACAEDFRVPFARLRPYLTPEGERNAARLQRP